MRRLLRGTFKLALVAGVIAALVALARKLMGGLGPEPGSADAPQEWPSLVPEPEVVPADVDLTVTVPNGQSAPTETDPLAGELSPES